MKKLVVSFMLVIFMFSVCYPAIYATENRMLNETTQTNEVTKEETNLERLRKMSKFLEILSSRV